MAPRGGPKPFRHSPVAEQNVPRSDGRDDLGVVCSGYAPVVGEVVTARVLSRRKRRAVSRRSSGTVAFSAIGSTMVGSDMRPLLKHRGAVAQRAINQDSRRDGSSAKLASMRAEAFWKARS